MDRHIHDLFPYSSSHHTSTKLTKALLLTAKLTALANSIFHVPKQLLSHCHQRIGINITSYRGFSTFTISLYPDSLPRYLSWTHPLFTLSIPCFGLAVRYTQVESLSITLFEVGYCFLLFDVLYYKRTNTVSISCEGAGDDRSSTTPTYALASPMGSSLGLRHYRLLWLIDTTRSDLQTS